MSDDSETSTSEPDVQLYEDDPSSSHIETFEQVTLRRVRSRPFPLNRPPTLRRSIIEQQAEPSPPSSDQTRTGVSLQTKVFVASPTRILMPDRKRQSMLLADSPSRAQRASNVTSQPGQQSSTLGARPSIPPKPQHLKIPPKRSSSRRSNPPPVAPRKKKPGPPVISQARPDNPFLLPAAASPGAQNHAAADTTTIDRPVPLTRPKIVDRSDKCCSPVIHDSPLLPDTQKEFSLTSLAAAPTQRQPLKPPLSPKPPVHPKPTYQSAERNAPPQNKLPQPDPPHRSPIADARRETAAVSLEAHLKSSSISMPLQASSPAPYSRAKKGHRPDRAPHLQEPPDVCKTPVGVHADVFHSLNRDHPGLTSRELCDLVIKPATASRSCAYTSILWEHSPQLLSAATCFISHAWSRPFNEILDAVYQYEEKHPNTYYWFDLFINNQHKATSFPFQWWCTTFGESIQSINKMMLVLSPWDKPVSLTRAWCLFEIYTSIAKNVTMNIMFPKSQLEPFKEALKTECDPIISSLQHLDLQKADAKNPEDKDQIFKVVEETVRGGFDMLNERIKDHMRHWYLGECQKIANTCGQSEEDAELLYNVGSTLWRFDQQIDSARQFLLKCLDIRHKLFSGSGGMHEKVAITYNSIAITWMKKGEYRLALSFFKKDLEIKRHLSKDPSKDLGIAHTLHSIGNAYHHSKQYKKALKNYRESLKIRRAVADSRIIDISETYGQIGQIYSAMQDYGKAEAYFKKDLNFCFEKLGEKHINTAYGFARYGHFLKSQGDEGWKEMLEKAYAMFKLNLGENHVDTEKIRRLLCPEGKIKDRVDIGGKGNRVPKI